MTSTPDNPADERARRLGFDDRADFEAWVKRGCKISGVPHKLQDPATIEQVAAMLRISNGR